MCRSPQILFSLDPSLIGAVTIGMIVSFALGRLPHLEGDGIVGNWKGPASIAVNWKIVRRDWKQVLKKQIINSTKISDPYPRQQSADLFLFWRNDN